MSTEEEDNEGPQEDVSLAPNDAADPRTIVDSKIPKDIRDRYEVYSYRNAAVILNETRRSEFEEILNALRAFSITTQIIRKAGGNETEIPKMFSAALRSKRWRETRIHADLHVTLSWREETGQIKKGKAVTVPKIHLLRRERYLDGHKIDYVKEKVAFDLEWNSKDQTFDRDLYAFNAFFLSGAIDAGILLTRSGSLDEVFRSVGPALKKDGKTVELTGKGTPRSTMSKYGASTTWMGKLLYRLNAGRNGGCPVLVFGITPKCVSDWRPKETS
jgi:hypothetical protein